MKDNWAACAIDPADAPHLTDRFGRAVEYLRISVTDRCDLRCSYCLPARFRGFEEPGEWLSFEEIVRVAGLFARLGVARVRLTGGEPLLRRNVAELAGRLSAIPGIRDLSLSTNATQLAQQARALRAAGISRLNVSLDTLRRERWSAISRKDALPAVLRGFDAAQAEGFSPIKINMVVMRGVNDDEIDEIVAFCVGRGFILRLIETMPLGVSGQTAAFADLQPVRQRLKDRFGLVDGIIPGGGPARYLVSKDGRTSVGFITPISQHFCATCNRVRLTVNGELHLCLGQEDRLDLRDLMRRGESDEGIVAAIQSAIDRKPERHEFREHPKRIVRVMASTGG